MIIRSRLYPMGHSGFHVDEYWTDRIRAAADTGVPMMVETINLRTMTVAMKSYGLVYETASNVFDVIYLPKHQKDKRCEMGIDVIDLNDPKPIPTWLPGVFECPAIAIK